MKSSSDASMSIIAAHLLCFHIYDSSRYNDQLVTVGKLGYIQRVMS